MPFELNGCEFDPVQQTTRRFAAALFNQGGQWAIAFYPVVRGATH
jgi:hypothetical protein